MLKVDKVAAQEPKLCVFIKIVLMPFHFYTSDYSMHTATDLSLLCGHNRGILCLL